MEDKKRKRAEDDDAIISDDNHAGKKAKYDRLFSTLADHLDSEARATYIASKAAQDVLAAIARGDADAINAGLAPPELDKSQRKKWRNSQRRLASQNSNSSGNVGRQECTTDIEDSAAVPNSMPPDDASKGARGNQSLTPISRDDLAALFFAGVACQLDESATKAFLSSQDAQHVVAAVLRGDEDAITASHAPPGLSGKKARLKWRHEQRLLAQRQRDIMLSKSEIGPSEAVSLGFDMSASIAVKSKSFLIEQITQAKANDEDVMTSAPASKHPKATTEMPRPESKSAGYTALVRPPAKVWNQPDGCMSVPATDRVTKSTTHTSALKVGGTSFAEKSATNHQPVKEPSRTHYAVSAMPEALGPSSRRSSHASNSVPHRVRSKESSSHVVPRRLPGDRNFDAPDFFARGSLADTERRFEAWARTQRGGQSDSSDSSSDEESDEDEARSPKPLIRGSFHESWADQIGAKSNKQSARASSKGGQPDADDLVSENSESNEDEDDEDDDAEVQTQVSRELQEATHASRNDVDGGVQKSLTAPPEVTVHVPDSQTTDDPSVGSKMSAGNPNEVSARRTIDPSALKDSKVQPPTPDQQAPGTPHGHPNAIRQANVRIKRILSHKDPGGDQSGHCPSEPVKRVTRSTLVRSGRQAASSVSHEGRFDHGELSDDVYDAIDDVTSDLLVTTKENIPSMDECKPEISNGQEMDHVLTIGSAIETTDLGENEVLTEVLKDARAEVKGSARAKDEEEVDSNGIPKHEDGTTEQNATKESTKSSSRTTSNSSSLSEFSRTPSLPSEPQVIIPFYIPETPEMKRAQSMKKKRKMTGNSSKHFGTAAPARPGRKSSALDDGLQVATPEARTHAAGQEGSSSVYVTAVSRRTRSAFKGPDLVKAEAIDTSDGEDQTTGYPAPIAERIPSTARRDTPNVQAPIAVDPGTELAATDEDNRRTRDEDSEVTRKSRPGGTNSPEPDTPFITPQEPPSAILPSTPPTQPNKHKKPRPKSKSTGRISNHFITDRVDLYNTTSTTPSKRLPAGLSRVPIPPTSASAFGLIQEKLYREPFWLLIAVTFLNKTAGRSAVPIFWKLKGKYQTAEALAEANLEELLEMVHRLGLQNQRSKRLIKIAKAWSEDPPVKGRRFRTLNYPCVGDGKAKDVPKVVEEDAADCTGALEIGHIPGCGEYAWDSWRIFCRDVFRGVAGDYIGLNSSDEDFEPEWKRVLPKDKELRACLRWMWVKEGYIWDPLTGDRRPVTDEEKDKAERGEMEIWDPGEAKFAVQAAAATAGEEVVEVDETPSKVGSAEVDRLEAQFASSGEERSGSGGDDENKDGEGRDEDEGESDTIHVTPRRPPTRAAKISRSVESDDGDEKHHHSEANTKSHKSTPTESPKRKARTSSLRADDEEEEEFEASKEKDRKKRRRSQRLTTA